MSTRAARRLWWIPVSLALCAGASEAATYSIGGTANHVVNSNLQLRLVNDPGCLADGMSFVLQSTNTNDCTTQQNVNKCCSQSIRFTATDGISRVTCTCGIIIIGAEKDDATDATQLLTVSPGATSFSFPTPLADISFYSVTIVTPPSGQRCSVSRGSGVVDGANVSNIYVDCNDGIFADGVDAR